MEKVKLKFRPQWVGDDQDTMNFNITEALAYVAKVSNPANQANKLTAVRLLKFLVDHKHWSPFEMVSFTLEIDTTRDIGRQILRHRSFSFQEFSQRYADVNALDNVECVPRETRLQDTKNRQSSLELTDEEWNVQLNHSWIAKQQQIFHETQLAYKWALQNNIAKEQARVVLPEGLTPSKLYMAGTLRSWIHYCMLRMEPGTQKEHREIAIDCWGIITDQIPSLNALVMNND
jgi:thymidylate synthase (FAD)